MNTMTNSVDHVHCKFGGKSYHWFSDRFYLDEISKSQEKLSPLAVAHGDFEDDNDGGNDAGLCSSQTHLASLTTQPSPYFSRRALVGSLVSRRDLVSCILMTYSCLLSAVKEEFPTLLATEVSPSRQVPVLLLHGDVDRAHDAFLAEDRDEKDRACHRRRYRRQAKTGAAVAQQSDDEELGYTEDDRRISAAASSTSSSMLGHEEEVARNASGDKEEEVELPCRTVVMQVRPTVLSKQEREAEEQREPDVDSNDNDDDDLLKNARNASSEYDTVKRQRKRAKKGLPQRGTSMGVYHPKVMLLLCRRPRRLVVVVGSANLPSSSSTCFSSNRINEEEANKSHGSSTVEGSWVQAFFPYGSSSGSGGDGYTNGVHGEKGNNQSRVNNGGSGDGGSDHSGDTGCGRDANASKGGGDIGVDNDAGPCSLFEEDALEDVVLREEGEEGGQVSDDLVVAGLFTRRGLSEGGSSSNDFGVVLFDFLRRQSDDIPRFGGLRGRQQVTDAKRAAFVLDNTPIDWMAAQGFLEPPVPHSLVAAKGQQRQYVNCRLRRWLRSFDFSAASIDLVTTVPGDFVTTPSASSSPSAAPAAESGREGLKEKDKVAFIQPKTSIPIVAATADFGRAERNEFCPCGMSRCRWLLTATSNSNSSRAVVDEVLEFEAVQYGQFRIAQVLERRQRWLPLSLLPSVSTTIAQHQTTKNGGEKEKRREEDVLIAQQTSIGNNLDPYFLATFTSRVMGDNAGDNNYQEKGEETQRRREERVASDCIQGQQQHLREGASRIGGVDLGAMERRLKLLWPAQNTVDTLCGGSASCFFTPAAFDVMGPDGQACLFELRPRNDWRCCRLAPDQHIKTYARLLSSPPTLSSRQRQQHHKQQQLVPTLLTSSDGRSDVSPQIRRRRKELAWVLLTSACLSEGAMGVENRCRVHALSLRKRKRNKPSEDKRKQVLRTCSTVSAVDPTVDDGGVDVGLQHSKREKMLPIFPSSFLFGESSQSQRLETGLLSSDGSVDGDADSDCDDLTECGDSLGIGGGSYSRENGCGVNRGSSNDSVLREIGIEEEVEEANNQECKKLIIETGPPYLGSCNVQQTPTAVTSMSVRYHCRNYEIGVLFHSKPSARLFVAESPEEAAAAAYTADEFVPEQASTATTTYSDAGETDNESLRSSSTASTFDGYPAKTMANRKIRGGCGGNGGGEQWVGMPLPYHVEDFLPLSTPVAHSTARKTSTAKVKDDSSDPRPPFCAATDALEWWSSRIRDDGASGCCRDSTAVDGRMTNSMLGRILREYAVAAATPAVTTPLVPLSSSSEKSCNINAKENIGCCGLNSSSSSSSSSGINKAGCYVETPEAQNRSSSGADFDCLLNASKAVNASMLQATATAPPTTALRFPASSLTSAQRRLVHNVARLLRLDCYSASSMGGGNCSRQQLEDMPDIISSSIHQQKGPSSIMHPRPRFLVVHPAQFRPGHEGTSALPRQPYFHDASTLHMYASTRAFWEARRNQRSNTRARGENYRKEEYFWARFLAIHSAAEKQQRQNYQEARPGIDF